MSSIVHVFRVCKCSPNSRCFPSSCLLALLATCMFLANSSPTSSSWNEWNVPPFCIHYQNNSVHMSQNSSKFDRQWLAMMNYAWNFSQSETEKYFEWIIIVFIIDVSRENWKTGKSKLTHYHCACSCSPPCRGPVGNVKLVCLVLWRKREYLTFISIRFVAFSNQNFADYRS